MNNEMAQVLLEVKFGKQVAIFHQTSALHISWLWYQFKQVKQHMEYFETSLLSLRKEEYACVFHGSSWAVELSCGKTQVPSLARYTQPRSYTYSQLALKQSWQLTSSLPTQPPDLYMFSFWPFVVDIDNPTHTLWSPVCLCYFYQNISIVLQLDNLSH